MPSRWQKTSPENWSEVRKVVNEFFRLAVFGVLGVLRKERPSAGHEDCVRAIALAMSENNDDFAADQRVAESN